MDVDYRLESSNPAIRLLFRSSVKYKVLTLYVKKHFPATPRVTPSSKLRLETSASPLEPLMVSTPCRPKNDLRSLFSLLSSTLDSITDTDDELDIFPTLTRTMFGTC
ncbi:hypothetical protein RR46_12300 [Papilio xuthus]|uniref:Uncharacterized protein n=1 Tax=Papilio xuthus TaxID=66420 RepID=A0A194PYN9_PAPXU|nr:hypothetical protein RR46_12300 [Papilio xuthus]